MSEPDDPNSEYERLLLRSADLDVPLPGARDRSLQAGLREIRSRGLQREYRVGGLVAGAFLLAAAAAAALYFRGEPVAPSALSAEAPAVRSAAPVVEQRKAQSCPELVVARGDASLLDDFEGNDARLLPHDGRSGAWSTYDDGTAAQNVPAGSQLLPTLIPGRRGESRRAMHVSGGKFTDWGVIVSADLAASSCYDVSRYAGLRFWARGKGVMHVGLQMIDVQALKFGGFCAMDCYNVHRKAVALGTQWQQYEARWEELRQPWPQNRVDFDPKRVRTIEFAFRPENTPFEVWLDDIEFILLPR